VELLAKILLIMRSVFEDYTQFLSIMREICAPLSPLCVTYFCYLEIKSLLT